MSNIISKIEIDSFRSIQKISIDVGNISVFSGLNDIGKSNVLKALNLFFNGQTDFGSIFDFNADYSKVSLASAQRSSKKKQQVKIKIYFKAPSSFKSLNQKDLWIERVFDRLGTRSEHSSLDDTQQRASLTRLLNNIQYFYIPALKGPDVLQYILGEVGKRKLIGESDITTLNETVNKNIKDLADILTKSSIQTSTKFELPVLVEDFWQKLNINTRYDEFEKLNTGIDSKRTSSDLLKEEFYQIPLQLRGEGIKSKYIPPLLQWIQEREPSRQYIWGIDEPENSLEFKKAQEVANLYFEKYSNKTQLFLTSHSLAFIFPDISHQNVNVFRCVRGEFGETKIQVLKDLFEKTNKYNLAEEIGALEVQKEIIEEWRIKDDQLKELQNKLYSLTKPIIFLEGEFDEIYFKKALEIYDELKDYPADIKWIGSKQRNDSPTFTGRDALNKAEQFLHSNQPQHKTILLYDVDCNKEVRQVQNVISYCPTRKKQSKYQNGIEHLFTVPDSFDPKNKKFQTENKKGDKIIIEPNKEAIKDYIEKLDKENQKLWLANLKEILNDIKTKYLQD